MRSIVNETDVNLLVTTDATIKAIYDLYQSPPNWQRPTGFITLSRIILEQQVSLASANAHFTKLRNYLKEFTPVEILKLTDAEMLGCHVSRQKATYLRALSTAICTETIKLANLCDYSETEITQQLNAIKGVGTWTTDVYLMFCLQAKDIFPVGDVAIATTMKELQGSATKQEMLKSAEKWRPFRSLASYFLWHYYLEKRKRKILI